MDRTKIESKKIDRLKLLFAAFDFSALNILIGTN